MSYIRSGSNPEGLYIFGSGEAIEIHPPYDPENPVQLYVPPDDFIEVCRMWDGNWPWCDVVKSNDFSAELVWVNSETETEEEPPPLDDINDIAVMNKYNEKVKLMWLGKYTYLWQVTWETVVHRVMWEQRMARSFIAKYTKSWVLPILKVLFVMGVGAVLGYYIANILK